MRLAIVAGIMEIVLASFSFGELLTLSNAELRAVNLSYDVRASYLNERAREWEMKNTISNYMPKVTIESNYARIDKETYDQSKRQMALFSVNDTQFTNPIFLPPFQMAYKNTFSHSLTITQPITNGGMEIIAIGIAKETRKAIELERRDLEQQVLYSTRKAYFDCIILLETIETMQADYEWTKKNLSMARIRYESGGIPVTDVLQFESDMTKKENDIAVIQANYQTALMALYHSIGVSIDKVNDSVQLQPVTGFEAWYKKGKVDISWNSDSILQVMALRHYTNIIKGAKQIAFTQFLPSLNSFFKLSSVSNDKFVKEERSSWVAGVSFNLTLFSGFRNSTKFRQADYDYKKAIVELEKSENAIGMNISRVSAMYTVSYDGVAAAVRQVSLMEKQLQVMQLRYEGGQVNQLELLSVALAVRNTKISYIQKLFECLLYESEFFRYTGMLEVSR